MEGTPADLTVYIDTDSEHDHTYYGNGCSRSEYPEGQSGSITPCSTRILQDGNGESQKNGTYYHFQAATSGSGASTTTDNTNTPDTFCPLGWQMPYGGTGGVYYDKSRSLRYLFNIYGIEVGGMNAQILGLYPFSYVLSGRNDWTSSRLYIQGNNTEMWSMTVSGVNSAYRLDRWPDGFDFNSPAKTNGHTLRCVKLLASHHRRHGGRKSCGFDKSTI